MQQIRRRAFAFLLLFLLMFAAVPAPALAAGTVEERLAALEERIQLLEKALAQTTLNVPALVEQSAPAVVSIYLTDEDDYVMSQGTGFIYQADGLILTNAHVVDEDYLVKVKFADGRVEPAERLMVDPFLDIAILDVEGKDHPTLTLSAEKPQVGEAVVVIGNAWGYSQSVTMGIVSGVDRPDPYHFHHYPSLQTDAAINHGNSGGPILNARGEVVAVAAWAELKDETEGLGFGIPADQIKAGMAKFNPERGIVRPWLGAAVREPYWSRGGLTNEWGLAVSDVHPFGAAYKAGLRKEDWVTHVNGRPVNYLMELRQELEKFKPGQTVTLTVDRRVARGEYETYTFQVKLGEYSDRVEQLVPYLYDWETDDLF